MIKITNITKEFQNGDVVTKVLRGITLEIKSGEFVAIMGASGNITSINS
jgi:ABC-type lipoprotein export system ATPase subunit